MLYFLIAVVLAVAILLPVSRWYPAVYAVIQRVPTGGAGVGVEFGAIVLQTVVMIWAVRDATVRTQKRPFLSLVSVARRIELRRILAGALAWLVAAAITMPVFALAGMLLLGGDRQRVPHLELPSATRLAAILLGLLVIPFQAGSEELLFRGWLTQTLGQFIRDRIVLALVVALLFALVHLGGGGPLALPYFMIGSLGLSAISLRDQRLELAIGAHAAQNLFVLLIATPLLEGAAPTLFGSTAAQIGALSLAGIAVQNALLYGICRLARVRGWLDAPDDFDTRARG